MTLEFTNYVRKPFSVQAIEVTEENIRDVARGLNIGVVKHDEDTGAPYILVDKKKIPNVNRVHAGYFVTKMGNNVRCYNPQVFPQQFTEITPDIIAAMEDINGEGEFVDDDEPVEAVTA
jgi:hypothetical protein